MIKIRPVIESDYPDDAIGYAKKNIKKGQIFKIILPRTVNGEDIKIEPDIIDFIPGGKQKLLRKLFLLKWIPSQNHEACPC